MMFINIYSKGRYSANALSNFYSHSFAFEGFKNIPCMEAFLQSLKLITNAMCYIKMRKNIYI